MSSISRKFGESFRWVKGWFRQAEGWQIALVILLGIFVLPVLPLVLTAAVVFALVLFGKAWVREFTGLMRLPDDAFPGRNDKLIWAIMLIVLPPVGAWMFQGYREAHWPEAKPAGSEAYEGF